ncbi:hypothetical protein ACNI3Q_00585 [Sphingomonas sp. FW199]|uniref:hypothetical protein n=1 Tax=unclassified Sphingomonas TaxID=196159 RepID=UPI0021A5BD97|nr:hypothetical protein [Sphingomonas sp. BGYR3]MDG5487740.1 hypothetical protein [Sphingomonas sp. BGYR3]
MIALFSPPPFDTQCRIEVEQSPEHFHAHVELDGDIDIRPGDRVRVHGAPIMVGFGERRVFERRATVQPAGLIRRAWTRFASNFEITELYEVSFTPGRLG